MNEVLPHQPAFANRSGLPGKIISLGGK
jgi:hypothetical protein